ncbi:glycosyltransferase family 4 protein [Candidatus Peregrinibacteria bacterium]|nr:glycosyltransferase family 4 protein [Candidatus Peregrinibacteria bacterium]
MRIAIDLRPLMSGKTTGVEMYMHNLLHALFQMDRKNEYVLWYNGFKTIDISHFPVGYPNVTLKRTRIPNKILNFCMSFLRWPKVDRLLGGNIDLLWVPDPRPAPISKKCKKVVTFHDLSFEEFNYTFSLRARLWHRVLRPKKEAGEANHLIAVSHFTKNQLHEIYGIPEEKITVIHEAAPEHLRGTRIPKLFEILRRKYKLPVHYVLALSTIELRKNVHGAIRAFVEWQEETHADVSLVVAGIAHPAIFKDVPMEAHLKLFFPGFIQEEDKAALYQHALCFLYPSFYEGFGLPILEAMQCGTPVITSDTTGTAEVAGKAAYLVNPNDLNAIKTALHEVYSDESKHRELREKGLQRAREFSWHKAADETLITLLRTSIQ